VKLVIDPHWILERQLLLRDSMEFCKLNKKEEITDLLKT
jgi:hypothetical protein